MTRRPGQLGTNRAIMGVLALVLIVVGVWVAFKSTRGVPAIPRYDLTVQFPTTGKLTAGADVMIAGNRIGVVRDVEATVSEEGEPVAEMKLAIEPKYEPLPADSVFSIHLLGALGKKYVQIRPGSSSEDLEDGSFVSIADNSETDSVTDIDEVLNTFDAPARAGTRTTFEALGLGLAGRGEDLNAFLQHFPGTLRESAAAMRILGDPDNGLATFVTGLTGVFAELAPAAPAIPGLLDLNTTFTALNSVAPELEETIDKTPEFLARVTPTLPKTARYIGVNTEFMTALAPGARVLPKTAPVLADAFQAGKANLPVVPRLSDRLIISTRHLADYSEDPVVIPGVELYTKEIDALLPLIQFITPAETVCSYPSLLVRNLTSTVKETFGTGTSVRAVPVVTDAARNSERGPSAGIWESPIGKALGPLHANPYPNTASPGQTYECEAGNEPYIQNRPIIGNVPGQQKATTESPVERP